jgi:hypothetical protein
MHGDGRFHIRRRELRLVAVSAVAFGAAVAALVPGVWPLMPFPAVAPVEVVAALGFLFGFLLQRTWVIALPFTILVALNPPDSGFAGALIALVVLSPFAAASAFLGIVAGRRLRRRRLRRALRAAAGPERVRPPDALDAPVSASRPARGPEALPGADFHAGPM